MEQLRENLGFVLVCVGVTAGLYILGKLVERIRPAKRDISPARRVSIVGICAALSALLFFLEFPLPFLVPEFYKLDFSELPVMLCGMYLGPSAAVACEAVKILLKLLFKGTTTAFVGDFANFSVGCSFVLPATIVYYFRKTRGSAFWGLVLGTMVMTVFGSAFNAIYLLPKFAQLFELPLDKIVAMGGAINGNIHSLSTFVLFAVAPLNLIKGISVSVLTLLLYKRVVRPLFGK